MAQPDRHNRIVLLGNGVYARRYSAAGTGAASELLVNTYTSGDPYSPSVAALDDGGFVVTWVSDRQDGSAHGV